MVGDSKISDFIEEYEEFRDSATVALEISDSLGVIVLDLELENQQLRDSLVFVEEDLIVANHMITQLSTQADSLHQALTDSIIEITPQPVLEYIEVLETQIVAYEVSQTASERLLDGLRRRNALHESVNEFNLDRINTLESALAAIPDTPSNPDKFLWIIPKPTRTQSFIAGAALGVIGYVVVGSGN
jgi:hypothetical protein